MKEELKKEITDFIVEKVNPDFIMLFGSQATGQTHLKSDTDLAFYKREHELSPYDIFTLAGELANITKTSVDLIDLNKASTVFKMQIFNYGIPLYFKDDYQLNSYETNVFRMYVDLEEKRREVLQEIHESGSVYGVRSKRSKE